jgi:GT2 family glycosyltransferase
MKQPEVSIIIVSWNVADLLDHCLSSIRAFCTNFSYEVIVVDSASSDNSVAMVRSKHPEVTLIAEPENVGFTKGNNIGLAAATGKHILYLNPDVELIEDAIGPMLEYLEAHADVGVVGCKLLNTDRSHQSSIGRYLRLSSLVHEYYLREKGEKFRVSHPDQATTVEVVLGACMLVRGEQVRAINGFDERYFMYQEETDMCLTLHRQGFHTVYLPTVAMIHHGSQSSTKSAESRQRTLHENRKSQVLFITKHYGAGAGLLAKLLIGAAMLIRAPLFAVANLCRPSDQSNNKQRYYFRTIRWLLIGR